MNETVKILLTIIGSVIASSGFWTYVNKKSDKNTLMTQMLIGLDMTELYILVCITSKEVIGSSKMNTKNLYKPYSKLGGNGSAERIMEDVKKRLRIVKRPPVMEVPDEI